MTEVRGDSIAIRTSIAGATGDPRFEGEHALAFQVGTALDQLDRLEAHMDPSRRGTRSDGLSDAEALKLRILVEDTYYDNIDVLREDDDRTSNPITWAIERHLRKVWEQEYYLPRTREATAEDFQAWLDGYLAQYGEKALALTTRCGSSFEEFYQGFRFAPRAHNHDLRATRTDLFLVQGCGSASLNVIESPGTEILRVIPGKYDHHSVYTNAVKPSEWGGRVTIPSDIQRRIPTKD